MVERPVIRLEEKPEDAGKHAVNAGAETLWQNGEAFSGANAVHTPGSPMDSTSPGLPGTLTCIHVTQAQGKI